MGDTADMMLDGTLCESCGEFMGEACGFPRLCSGCQNVEDIERPQKSALKVACPHCKKKVKQAGLHDHIRDVHKGST